MTFDEIFQREIRREFADHIQFDRGASRSIARRAARETPHGTKMARLPLRRKLAAFARTVRYSRNSK